MELVLIIISGLSLIGNVLLGRKIRQLERENARYRDLNIELDEEIDHLRKSS